MFFAGTAARGGRLNIALEKSDTLRILGSNGLVWLNLIVQSVSTSDYARLSISPLGSIHAGKYWLFI